MQSDMASPRSGEKSCQQDQSLERTGTAPAEKHLSHDDGGREYGLIEVLQKSLCSERVIN